MSMTVQGGLKEFSASEYSSALPLYLSQFNIRCELADEARRACQHPLLLRFFCEAYGSVDGPEVQLGLVRDIRLKELFDEYFTRKVAQIRQFLHHGNADLVISYLSKLIAYLFNSLSVSIFSTEIQEATGDADLSTENSLYLRLLDEDIIIEEQPTESIEKRRIGFVYEEFMEYLLARTLIAMPERFGLCTVSDIFQKLYEAVNVWVNARGVGEYVGIMSLEGDFGYSREDAINFITLLARGDSVWPTAFWSVIGKLSEENLNADVFDLFFDAIKAFSDMKVIRNALEAMSRYSQEGCQLLAAILLWSAAVPKFLSWSEFYRLSHMCEDELKELSSRLVSATYSKVRFNQITNISYKDV